MDDDAGPSRLEKRVLAFAQNHQGCRDVDRRRSVGLDGDIGQIARMRPFGVLETVLFPERVEVSSRRLEIGRMAFCNLMDVKGMLTGWEILDIELDSNPVRRW